MTQDEIRKLLGGYATDTLTEAERKILFEAALEDQDLFNALHDEDALRELLADPVSRHQVRRALEDSVPADTRRAGFWSRGWVIGTAAIVLASAAAVAIVMVRQTMFHPPAPAIQIASSPTPQQQAAPSEQAPAAPKLRNEPRRDARKKAGETVESLRLSPANPAPPPAPERVIPAPVQLETARDAVAPVTGLAVQGQAGAPPQAGASPQANASPMTASFRAATPPPLPDIVRQQFTAGFPANAPLYQGPLVRYSLVRSGPDGDAVRVEISTGIVGYMALYQVDKAGDSKRVYPAAGPAVLVLPGRTVQIPNSPLKISDAVEKLRLVVMPAGRSAVIGQLGGAISPAPAAPTPLVVDIPLGPN